MKLFVEQPLGSPGYANYLITSRIVLPRLTCIMEQDEVDYYEEYDAGIGQIGGTSLEPVGVVQKLAEIVWNRLRQAVIGCNELEQLQIGWNMKEYIE